jgi:2-keto-4-pentenoate hydratase
MNIATDAVIQAARRLRDAEATGTPCAPVRELFPGESIEAAYKVQRLNFEQALASGRRLSGRKIGLTAKAVQRQLGVDQPDYGALFADMERGDGDEVAVGTVLQPRAEAEIALVLERDLAHEQPTLADLLRSIAYALPAIEIVGSRIANWDIRIVDTIADNASSGLYVLGGPARRIDGLDLRTCRMTMARNGHVVSSGDGAACLGNPLHAALWLARCMVRLGSPLHAGDVIMTGALGPMVAAQPGDAIEAVISGVGSVRTAFAASSALAG